MAQLPGPQSIPLQTPAPSRAIGTYQPGVVQQAQQQEGLAIAQAGQKVTQTGDTIFDAQSSIAEANATTSFLNAKLSADEAAKNDPNHADLPERYQTTLAQARDQAAAGIQSPVRRAQFITQSAFFMGRGVDNVQNIAHGKSIQADRDWLTQYTQGSVDGFSKSNDDADRNQFLASAHDAIDGMRVKGSITASEAAQLRKQVGGTAVAQNIETLLARDDPKAAQEFYSKWGDNLDPANRLAVEQRLKPALIAKQAQEAGDKYIGKIYGAPPSEGPQLTPISIPPEAKIAAANNNPGNLRFAGQDGATQGVGGFAKFETPEQGAVALRKQIDLDTSRGQNLGEFITKYAPPSENNTAQYIQQASASLGVDPNTSLKSIDPDKLAAFIGQKESGTAIPVSAGTPSRADAMHDRASVLANIAQDYKDNPALGKAVSAYVTNRFAITDTELRAREMQDKAAQEQAGGKFVSSILGNQIQNAGDATKMQQAIANDPTLTWENKDRITNILRSSIAKEAAGDTKNYGTGIWKALQAVNAPEGDPTRINSASQVWAMGGNADGSPGDLTVAGVNHVLDTLNKRQKSVDDAGEQSDLQASREYIKKHMTFQDEYGFIKDAKGMDAFQTRAIPAFNKAYAEGRASGKTAYQLLSKDSPDFLADKMIEQFKRPDAEYAKDRLDAGDVAAGEINTPEGLKAAVQSGKMTREQGIAEALKRGYIRSSAPAPQAPMAP